MIKRFKVLLFKGYNTYKKYSNYLNETLLIKIYFQYFWKPNIYVSFVMSVFISKPI